MDYGKITNPHFFEPVRGMIPHIQRDREFIGISRIMVNLYTNQGKPIVHPTHVDVPLDSGVADNFLLWCIT
jgi:hypothetical protein